MGNDGLSGWRVNIEDSRGTRILRYRWHHDPIHTESKQIRPKHPGLDERMRCESIVKEKWRERDEWAWGLTYICSKCVDEWGIAQQSIRILRGTSSRSHDHWNEFASNRLLRLCIPATRWNVAMTRKKYPITNSQLKCAGEPIDH